MSLFSKEANKVVYKKGRIKQEQRNQVRKLNKHANSLYSAKINK